MGSTILIGIPAYGSTVSLATFDSTHLLLQALMTKGIRGGIGSISYPEVSEARNVLLTSWYDGTDASHLLFVDADMGFAPQLVLDMMMFNEPMVGAMYSKKVLPVQWAASGLGEDFTERRGDFMKIAGLGMGCFLIRRDVVDRMMEAMPDLSDTRVETHSAKHMLMKGRILRFFDPLDDPKTGRMSEDLSFCYRWREKCGGEIWAAIGHDVEHVGLFSYTANYLRHITEKEAAGEIQTPLSIAAE